MFLQRKKLVIGKKTGTGIAIGFMSATLAALNFLLLMNLKLIPTKNGRKEMTTAAMHKFPETHAGLLPVRNG